MSVEMALDINATTFDGSGTISVSVSATNNGNQPVNGMAAAFAFWLVDQNQNYVPGFTPTGVLPDYVRLVAPGGNFGFTFHFSAPSVDNQQIYTLICYFQQTQDESTQTFTFQEARTFQTV